MEQAYNIVSAFSANIHRPVKTSTDTRLLRASVTTKLAKTEQSALLIPV